MIRGSNSVEALDAAELLLTRHAKTINEFDAIAAKRMLQEITEQKTWVDILGVKLRVADWLESVVQETSINESGPRPGCIHMASLATGGQSGRPITFVIAWTIADSRGPCFRIPFCLIANDEVYRLNSQPVQVRCC